MSASGTPHPPPKSDPETLRLRAAPRRVIRFKRNLLIGVAALASAGILGAAWLALSTHVGKIAVNSGPVDTHRQSKPDALNALPSNYNKIRLGPPLSGDLGPPVVAREKSLGVTSSNASFKPNPEDDVARAERMRLAQQARQAAEAGVFFRLAKPVLARATPREDRTGANRSIVTPQLPGDNGRLNLDLANDQNAQGHKRNFIKQKIDASIYNPHALQTPVSPYEVLALQLRFFGMCTACLGLVSASPEGPRDDVRGLNASLRETVCYAADFLDRPADEIGRFWAGSGFVFLGIC